MARLTATALGTRGARAVEPGAAGPGPELGGSLPEPAPPVRLDPARDFAAVYEVHYGTVFAAVRGVLLDAGLAEDVTQDAFIKAYRARDRYRPSGSVGAWLCTIAVREALSRLRWRRLQRRLLVSVRSEVARLGAPEEAVERLDELLATLSHKVRAVVVLHFLHGYRYREIAAILGIPEGTVSSRLTYGLSRMRAHLEATDHRPARVR